MAVFIMAIGILSIAALFPLGLRESSQSQADMKQAMLADYLLNQAVAAASRSDLKWSDWCKWVTQNKRPPEKGDIALGKGTIGELPDFMQKDSSGNILIEAPDEINGNQYRIACCVVPGFSDRVMGIMVVSTDISAFDNYNQYSNNPVYYAEAMFQGDPSK